MARRYLTLSALALLAQLAAAEAPADTSNTREHDTYRPTATYAVMRGSTPAACEAACEQDGQCRAWSLTPPTFRAGPKCELKSATGRSVAKAAAVSGTLAPSVSKIPAPTPAPAAQTPLSKPADQLPDPTSAPAAPTLRAQPAPPATARPAASPTQPVVVEPYLPPQPAPAPSAERPWPGLRRSSDEAPKPVYQEGTRPLPSRRGENVPSYSVQSLEALPGDVEDTGGLKGRLPSGQGEEAVETAED